MSHSTTAVELETFAASTPLAFPEPSKLSRKGDDAPPVTEGVGPINTVNSETIPAPTKATTTIVLITVVCVTMVSALMAGQVVVGLPTMAEELDIPPSLLLW